MINQPQIEQNKLQFSQRLDEKITLLLNKQTLNTKILKSHTPKYLYQDVVSQSMNDANLKKMIEIGQRCKGIVVKKDESKKQLLIHLTKLVFVEPQNKYLKSKSCDKQPQEIFIHQFKQFGFMKDYDIKEPFSVFTYINSYKDIKLGSEVYGIIVRKEKRNSIVLKESQSIENNVNALLTFNKVWCEISIKNEPPKNSSTKINLPLLGIKYDQRFYQVVDNNYEKTGNFSITKLALYANNFGNNDIISRLKQGLDIDLNQNINPISNIKALKHMHIDFQRIRQTQEKKWASDHFMQGLEFLKRGNNQYAIENFDVAKKFDKDNEKIYIAKGCALANMNNFSEGLKEIKEALKINPDNEQANQYYKTIREKLRDKEGGPELRKKQSSHSSPKYSSKRT